MPHLIFLLECRLLFYSWHVLHGQALPGSMSGSLKTILRGSTSRVNLPNAQSNDCGRSPTNDGNGNAASCDLSSGSLNAPPRLWQLPYTKLSPWMAPQWGQTPARYSHPIDFEYFGRTPQFTSSKRRNAWDNSPALSTPLQETIRQRYPSRPASSRNRPVCMVLYPHFQQGTGLTLRIKATLLSVHTSGALYIIRQPNGSSEYQLEHNVPVDISCRWFVF